MAKFDSFTMIFILTMVPLMTYTNQAVDQATRIRRTVGAHLVLLNTHKNLFTETNESTRMTVEEEKRNAFMNRFETRLGTNYASEILTSLGPDWTYTLKIAKTTSKVTTLLVAMHAKYQAYIYGLNYLFCSSYYQNVKLMVAESCRNVAVHLLFYSFLGVEELEEKLFTALSSHIDPQDNVFEDNEFHAATMNLLYRYHNSSFRLFTEEGKETGSQDTPTDDVSKFKYIYRTLRNITYAVDKIKSFLANLLFGKKDSESREYHEEFDTLWKAPDEVALPMWNTAIEINRKLTNGNDEHTYRVIDIVQDIMKEYAVRHGHRKGQTITHDEIDREFDQINPRAFVIFEDEAHFYDHNIRIVPNNDIDAILHTRATGTRKTAASHLVLLNTYNDLFQKNGQNLSPEKTKQDEFMGERIKSLGPKNTKEIENNLGAHWAYALKIANDDNNLTALLTVIHAKYLAYNYGINYLWCAKYHRLVKQTVAESCRNVAAHLLLFSMFNADEVGKKLIAVLEGEDAYSLDPSVANDINVFHGRGMDLLNWHMSYLRTIEVGRNETKELKEEVGSSYKSIENEWQYKTLNGYLLEYGSEDMTLRHFFENFIFGEKDSEYSQYKASFPITWYGTDELVHPLWNKAIEINSKLTGKTDDGEYGIVDVIRDVTIEYAVLHGRRKNQTIEPEAINEELTRLQPAQLNISVGSSGRLEHNIKITG